MSTDFDQHLILHHLDDPLRILLWTLDEAAFLLLCPFLGLFIDHPFLGLLIAGVGYYALKKVKKKFGSGTLKHVLYWYLPPNKRALKCTPPSYIREYVG